MPCVSLPAPTIPTLPTGITFAPTIPPFGGDVDLCCKQLAFAAGPSILPLPPLVFNPATAAILQALYTQISAYHDAIPLRCPRE